LEERSPHLIFSPLEPQLKKIKLHHV